MILPELFDRIRSDKSLNHSHFQTGFRPFVLSKTTSHFNKNSSSDSFSNRLSRKSSYQSNDNEFVSRSSIRASQSIRVTRMLVIVSTCFLILNAPAHLCVIALKIYTSIDVPVFNERNDTNLYYPTKNLTIFEIANFVWNNDIDKQTNNETLLSSFQHEVIVEDQMAIHLFYMATLLTQSISFASYSINFFLYSFSGVAFRTSLKQFINTFRKQ
ncbi:unnamed protein product [Rotaria sp. Silwood2]|nr:unnamed protein product [Rotaria sp. Silwood2]